MAATTYAGGNHTTTAGSKTVTATPAVGDLIVIVGASSGLASALDITPTDNNADGNGAYTRVALAQSNANTELEAVYIRNALIGSATSTVFTLGLSASNTGGGLTVYRISGMTKTGLTAMLQKIEQSGGASGAAPSVTFPSAANTNNVIIGAVMANQATANAITPPTNYTEDAELTYTTPSRVLEVVHRDSGETGTTITWGTTTLAWAAIAVELDTSAGGPSAHPRSFGVVF
jgi:hypothetical protein